MSGSRTLEMFQSGQGADCVIEVAPQIHGQDPEIKEFNVNKYVLMVNSDVFMAMFSHKTTKEAREGHIQIEDSTPTAVRQMLIYMYTGELPEKDYAIETDAVPLMAIADKYQIKPLMDFNAKILSIKLTLESENKVLGLEKYDDSPLLRYIRKMQKSWASFANRKKKIAHREITKLWKKDMSSRALKMFQTGEGADCVIEVVHQHQQDGQASKQQKKKEFNVHKYVLMVNSDVFMAMFSHGTTKEAREGRILITDSTSTAMYQMLTYMYTGALPTEYDIETDAGHLLYIANKYQIQSLIHLIEQGLINSLSLKNVFDRVELADLYQIKALFSSCGKLIRRNLKMLKKEAKWLDLKNKSPDLAFSILEEFAEEFERIKLTIQSQAF